MNLTGFAVRQQKFGQYLVDDKVAVVGSAGALVVDLDARQPHAGKAFQSGPANDRVGGAFGVVAAGPNDALVIDGQFYVLVCCQFFDG